MSCALQAQAARNAANPQPAAADSVTAVPAAKAAPAAGPPAARAAPPSSNGAGRNGVAAEAITAKVKP